jgi:hypothetical protein
MSESTIIQEKSVDVSKDKSSIGKLGAESLDVSAIEPDKENKA